MHNLNVGAATSRPRAEVGIGPYGYPFGAVKKLYRSLPE